MAADYSARNVLSLGLERFVGYFTTIINTVEIPAGNGDA
jgi:hypothetical protein